MSAERRVGLVFTLLPMALALGKAGQSPTQRLTVARFVENEVGVEVFVERGAAGTLRLGGTFTPLLAQFHVYSKDLPKRGVRGLGRPSLIQIVSPGAIYPAGALEANRPTNDVFIEALNLTLPVYPEGPVTLSLAVRTSRGHESKPTVLSITYAACSERTCLPPVIDKRISVAIPDSITR
jgi:hypothetical protein